MSLEERVLTDGDIVSPGLNPAAPFGPASKALEFPDFLLGDWTVTSTFTNFRTPLGPRFAHPGSAEAARRPASEGGVGSTTTYPLRFVRTQPGGPVQSDRPFNARSAFNARTKSFLGFEAVFDAEYDPKSPNNKLVLTFSTLGADLRPLPPKRLEVGINNRASGPAAAGGDRAWCASEFCRQVLVAPRRVEVEDYEVLWRWEVERDGVVRARQRRAEYLQPQDQLYFDAKGRAIAVYDYDVTMCRVDA
ncbi:unnamed protein product [Pedinophyceae sp. YPF-701]|nr:unnamed protein product [Pedinophyceae sp. YPF-701]